MKAFGLHWSSNVVLTSEDYKDKFFFLKTDKAWDVWQALHNHPIDEIPTLPEATEELLDALPCLEPLPPSSRDVDIEDDGWTTSLHEMNKEPTESLVVVTKKSVYQHQLKMPKLERYKVTRDEICNWLSYHIQWEDTKNETEMLVAQPSPTQIMNAFGLQLDSNVVPTDDCWYKDNFIFFKTNHQKTIWQIIHESRRVTEDNRNERILRGLAFSRTTQELLLDVLDEAVQGGWITSLHEVKNEPTEELIVITTKVAYQHLKNRDINHLPWQLLQCQTLVEDKRVRIDESKNTVMHYQLTKELQLKRTPKKKGKTKKRRTSARRTSNHKGESDVQKNK